MTLRLNGDGSGFTEIKAPNEAGDNSITLPDSNGGANQILKNSTTAGELQFASEVLIDHNNRLLVGNTESQGNHSEFQVRKDFDGRSVEIFRSFDSNSTPGRIQFSTSRGTASSSTAMQDGGKISEIRFTGHDGTNFIPAAEISSDVSGAPGTNVMPGRLIFSTNSGGSSVTDRVEIGSNGALKLLAGCPGIDFSGTQPASFGNATMSSETLDSYEEGRWEPELKTASGTHPVYSLTHNYSTYTKVGRLVFFNADIIFTFSNVGTGNMYFSLPFAVAAATEAEMYSGGGLGRNTTALNFNQNLLSWYYAPGFHGALLYKEGTNGAEVAVNNSNFVTGTNRRFNAAGFYYSPT